MNSDVTLRSIALHCILIAFFGHFAGAASADSPSTRASAESDFFEREIRPVLLESCIKCHGPEKQWSGLRLDSRKALLKGGETGPAMVPGKPNQSTLISAIRQTGDISMPPDSKLNDRQIAALARWVQIGAPWPESVPLDPNANERARGHWAFQPVVKPRLPESAGQNDHPVDAFVRAKLREQGLAHSPPANRRTLIRRATFDLTGLPPTPEEVERFVNDKDSRAYEKLIDRLLNSPRYGEQWARHWLDVARYSDTKGYVYAREERFWVHAWAYRDWVVNALNDDLPYDRFLLLQLAADQVAPGDKASLAAMGFLTVGRRFLGVTHDVIDDRIDVVTRGTMGLTVACARCHDHKYDPIPTRDYYSLYGVFANCSERTTAISEPAEKSKQYQAFEAELQKRQQALEDATQKHRREWQARVRERVADYLFAQLELHKYPAQGFDQVLSKSDILPAFVRRWHAYLARPERAKDPVFVPWLALTSYEGDDFARHAIVTLAMLTSRPAGEVSAPVLEALSSSQPKTLREVADAYGAAFAAAEAQQQAVTNQQTSGGASTSTIDPALEPLIDVLYGPDGPCVVPDEPIVHTETYFDTGTCVELWKLQGEVDRHLIRSELAQPYALYLVDRPHVQEPRVFHRGNPSRKGDVVARQVPAVIATSQRQPFQHGSGRLELAQAIVSPDNPLTARVIVNRVWMHHFGEGLVRTPSDFGVRAVGPSHPKLLDWLASTFAEQGWSLKKLHRLLMTSATYQQTSTGPTDKKNLTKAVRQDPDNHLLWRMNARRLSFEEMRDALLAVTGELDFQTGGKPSELLGVGNKRRSLYGLIDRQFLPSTLRVFDFANPDLHVPARTDTTVPQQALFFLNNDFLLGRAEDLAKRFESCVNDEERIQQMFHAVYQRRASPPQVAAALEYVHHAKEKAEPVPSAVLDWQYGYGEYDEKTQKLISFERLPYFAGSAWQGGRDWPDKELGWVRLTATGGHPGNNRQRAAVRRWTAPADATIRIDSRLEHPSDKGDGIRGFLISSRHGLLDAATLHKSSATFNVFEIEVSRGDVLDFVVDLNNGINSDDYHWTMRIINVADDGWSAPTWDSKRDFEAQPPPRLDAWEQLAQVLLSSNEFLFVD